MSIIVPTKGAKALGQVRSSETKGYEYRVKKIC